MAGKDVFSEENKHRIVQELKRIGAITVSRLMSENIKVPNNCPVAFFDNDTKYLVVADMWIDYHEKIFSHRYSNIDITNATPAQHVDNIIEAYKAMKITGTPLLCDENTLDMIATADGTTVLGHINTPYDTLVERPGGVIAVCLPDPNVPWISIPSL